jgi:3-dehydroquinate synthase
LQKNIKVKLSERSYEIFIQDNLLNKCGPVIKKIIRSKKIAVLSNPLVFKNYGKYLVKSLKNVGLKSSLIFISNGENYKNENSLFYILKKLARNGFQRDSCLLALGGGVIGDLGGLASSIYMRGIDFVQCPTTLLAQVDASIGGKTAIDFEGVKNLIGTFYQPRVVIIDPIVLKTLDERQFKTGLAEVIKYSVIRDKKMFEYIENNIDAILNKDQRKLHFLISKSCDIKASIISKDEKENGRRAWLNYGHTLGHALESYYKFRVLTHGEAISYGMWFASLLSLRLGLCSNNVLKRQVLLFKKIGLLQKLPHFDPRGVYQRMFLDKKVRNGLIHFVLTRKIGLVTIQKNIQQSIVLSALAQFQFEVRELL